MLSAHKRSTAGKPGTSRIPWRVVRGQVWPLRDCSTDQYWPQLFLGGSRIRDSAGWPNRASDL